MPFGEDFIHQQSTAAYYTPFTFSGKERDAETSLSYFGARYYDAGLSIWLSVDPMSDKYPSLSAYNYCALNPVLFIDPNGMNFDVFITGPDADRATEAVNASSSLEITRSEDGKLHATGEAKTAADKKLLEAINNPSVIVELETKRETSYDSHDGKDKNIPLTPGGFEGSTIIGDLTVAVQYVNMDAAQNLSRVIGESVGETLTHEINEAYIGAVNFPGQKYQTAYTPSHNRAASLDRVNASLEWNKDTKRYPNQNVYQARRAGTETWFDITTVPK